VFLSTLQIHPPSFLSTRPGDPEAYTLPAVLVAVPRFLGIESEVRCPHGGGVDICHHQFYFRAVADVDEVIIVLSSRFKCCPAPQQNGQPKSYTKTFSFLEPETIAQLPAALQTLLDLPVVSSLNSFSFTPHLLLIFRVSSVILQRRRPSHAE
jgi:hypothetical protein